MLLESFMRNAKMATYEANVAVEWEATNSKD